MFLRLLQNICFFFYLDPTPIYKTGLKEPVETRFKVSLLTKTNFTESVDKRLVPRKTKSCFGCRRHLQRYNTDENIGLLENARGLVTKSRRPMHKDHQGRVHYTTDYRNVYFHISLHCWRRIFPYLQLSDIGMYKPRSALKLDHYKRFYIL